ncbi:NAD(P)/FAD-dependent oxidoreductase [Devosia faecipullorum]|uniref:NAD(P)/FAD-dependent oxidoreductase n=1 Tax=Devosia faecipullorum TaxID=2755039 RepID=UPI00187B3E7C|nr:NAD(P)/FAD-dependent oxidoreductase [Devosia faecipullorum]MBE7731955.1 NAD(P)/FAD-dependent oxidoreductase [Devosia faecipullorum]
MSAIVIGAGIIGLAIGRALAMAGHDTFILDGEADFGTWTSARNSEVIHAGIYYPKGSIKARLCVEGKSRLYAYCIEREVPHRNCRKLIFAADASQSAKLDEIAASAQAAGVTDLTRFTGADVRQLEPALACHEALLSPSTGIIDSHAYMLALLADAETHGAQLVCRTKVDRIVRRGGEWLVYANGESQPAAITDLVVNAGGLGAQQLAGNIEGLDPATIPPLHLARGVYFSYAGASPFQHLIYPIPEHGGLGTHLTMDLAGQIRFGPDVEWISEIDYRVDPNRHAKFVAGARQIWADIDPTKLRPAFAGIRPKLSGPGEPAADFSIMGPADHGAPGLVNLFGIESPGLTASLPIADLVLEKLATNI